MSMKDREKGHENKFAHDEATKFKALARRNKLLGLWAAEALGYSGEEADAYAKEVVLADFEEAGDQDVFRKVKGDFEKAQVAKPDAEIHAKMQELLTRAIQEVAND